MKKKTADQLAEQLVEQLLTTALKLPRIQRMDQRLDILKAVTNWQSVKNRAKAEGDEGNGFSALIGQSALRAGGPAGVPAGPDADVAYDPEFDDSESQPDDEDDRGAASNLNGAGQ